MVKLYLYNNGTHTLHINDFCSNAKGSNLMGFDSEDEALNYAGRSLGMCKTCMEKRDAILLEHVKNTAEKKKKGDAK